MKKGTRLLLIKPLPSMETDYNDTFNSTYSVGTIFEVHSIATNTETQSVMALAFYIKIQETIIELAIPPNKLLFPIQNDEADCFREIK